MEEKVKINIPKADEKEVVMIPRGEFGEIRRKFEKIDQILFSVMIVVVLSMVAIIVAVIGIFLDQMRYNNAAYKEYSEGIKNIDAFRNSNTELLRQNKQNQDLIINQQKKILELLTK